MKAMPEVCMPPLIQIFPINITEHNYSALKINPHLPKQDPFKVDTFSSSLTPGHLHSHPMPFSSQLSKTKVFKLHSN